MSNNIADFFKNFKYVLGAARNNFVKSSLEDSFKFSKSFLKSFRFLLLIVFSSFVLLNQSCSHVPVRTDFELHSEALLKARYFSVDIPSFDGTRIRATVYQPALGPKDSAPVIIHAHAFGFNRMSQPLSLYGRFLYTGKTAIEAWRQGYWVISYDQRGHGASGGKIGLMDPNFEVRDLSYIIDWIENNIPRLAYRDSDPVVGMIGESYGGGVQLLGAGMDRRIDAIIPVTTWNDIKQSLYPNDVAKSGWLTTLVAVGNLMNPGKMLPLINKAYIDARSGELKPSTISEFAARGAAHACACNAEFQPHADALIIQGFRDVLFPLNEAVRNAECFKANGRDVRIVGIQDGHLLPFVQSSKGILGFNVEEKVHCGNKTLRTQDMALSWFDEKLKGISKAAQDIPEVCLTHDYESGSVFTEVPRGGTKHPIELITVYSGGAGFFEMPMRWIENISSWIASDKRSSSMINAKKTSVRFRPAFVPLREIEGDSFIAGIPSATIELMSHQKNTRVFVGVGVKKKGSRNVQLLSDQITPIKGVGRHELDLAAISSRLKKGDILGFVVYGYNNQFRFSGSSWSTRTELLGSIELPIQTPNIENQYVVQRYK